MGCFVPFISVFYLVGFSLLVCGVASARRSMRAADWPVTQGTITHLSVRENAGDDTTSYEVIVRYTYTVDGAEYESSRLAFGYAGTSGREAHDQIHQKLKDAKTVDVRYNPSDPTESCLSFGLHRTILIMLAFSITWLAFVFGFTILWWLSSRDDRVLLNNLSIR